ncbi:MAG: Flp family type IVb pilin [Azospirillaceae bacterium]
MLSTFKRFLKDESGATAIEYALIAALIAIAIIGGLQALSTQLNTTFGTVESALAGAGGS